MEKIGCLTHLFVTIFLSAFSMFVVMPALTDVTMEALCPGQDECSLAIYLSGFQQAVTGIGSVMMTPLIGNLSDVYGRKTLLTLPLTLSILPLVVLAYSRERSFFYAYYVLKTVASMICEGTVHCLSLAYIADKISESKRASAFGVIAGVGSAAFVCGTVAARLLSTAQTFQAATFSAMAAAVYMRIFLEETTPEVDASTQHLLKSETSSSSDGNSSKRVQVFKTIPTIHDIKSLLGSSKTFSQVTVMVLFNSLAEGGIHASLMLVLMPVLLPVAGEEWLLRFGLLVASTNMILNSIAWDVWVIYAVAGCSVFVIFTNPCMRSIASKQVGGCEQGKAQGCISAVSSLANIISPLVFSPLTATFLSDEAPIHFPGFSLLCAALCTAIAFIQSLMIRRSPQIPGDLVA